MRVSQIDEKILESLRSAGALRETLLQERLDNERARCNMCQWRCHIPSGGVGHCRTVVNQDGILFTTIYGVVSSAAADPIEKKPVFHYKPGSLCFSVGTLGCNFRCVFCQNWEIAYADAISPSTKHCSTGIEPSLLVELAKRHKCEGVAWTYNEPAIWLNYTFDSAKKCKESGLYTVYVTNGYATPEALDLIGPYLDVYRVDIKSTEVSFYKELIKIPQWQGILEVAERAKHKWNMHVECVTNIIPGWNDTEDNLRRTALWIADKLGAETPWHVTRFYPYGKLSHLSPTPIETLHKAAQIGKQAGLKFVYLGNVHTDTGENTYCPTCGTLVVRRLGYRTEILALDSDGRCAVDHTDLNIHV
ncbi:MAG: AmmeMemoRadiSam system radical SAM enzyme [Armatimonadota bacterium]